MNAQPQILNISEIILLDINPRDITDQELQKLAEDIKSDPKFLYQRPPLINEVGGKYYCYAGTQRIKAQILNGETTIPCFVEKDVPKHIQDKRMVIDNLHRGTWNEDKLLALDIPLEVMSDFGFKDFEVSLFDIPPPEPTDLTAPYKEAPPTMKFTFENTKQMENFEREVKGLIESSHLFSNVTYSVSQGEI